MPIVPFPFDPCWDGAHVEITILPACECEVVPEPISWEVIEGAACETLARDEARE